MEKIIRCLNRRCPNKDRCQYGLNQKRTLDKHGDLSKLTWEQLQNLPKPIYPCSFKCPRWKEKQLKMQELWTH